MKEDSKGSIFALISGTTFGIEAILVKLLYAEGINTETLLFFRFLIAVVFLWIYAAFFKKMVLIPDKRLVLKLLLLGMFVMPLTTGLLMYSYNYIAAPVGIMCLYAYPVFVTVWSTLFLNEKLSFKKVLSLFLAVSGLILVIGSPSGSLNIIGILLALSAAFVNSFIVIINRKIMSHVEPLLANLYYITGKTITYIMLGSFAGKIVFEANSYEIILFLLLGIISTIVPEFAILKALELTEASRVGIISMIEPVVTAVLAAVILNEILTSIQIVGGILVLSGIYILNNDFPGKKRFKEKYSLN